MVSDSSYGVIVEGDYDAGVYEELIQKICGGNVRIISRPAGNRVELMKKMTGLLRSLEYISVTGGPVDKALVIRDADGKNSDALEQEMSARFRSQTFRFPSGIQVHAVRQEMETWLLADPAAIDWVAKARSVRDKVGRVRGALESIQRPSQKLGQLLSSAGLNYTAQVCREIAQAIDLGVLRNLCPSFREFERKVLDP